MTMVLLPITLTTTALLAILCLILAIRVSAGRVKNNVLMGDAGNADMVMRMRTHANFTEYVPLLLILMGLLELGGGSRTVLMVFGGVLVLSRVMHAVGMARPAPSAFRAIGALATFLLLLLGAAYALVLTWYAWTPAAA